MRLAYAVVDHSLDLLDLLIMIVLKSINQSDGDDFGAYESEPLLRP
jgi:hypothetical protein